jgi:hypothetical protein
LLPNHFVARISTKFGRDVGWGDDRCGIRQRFASTAAPIRESFERIMLSSGGVGYFEYEATVDGNATKVTVRPE